MGISCACVRQSEPKVKVDEVVVYVGAPELDDPIKRTIQYINNVKDLQSSLLEAEIDILQLSKCSHMQNPSLKEAIRVLFWAISAGNSGNLDNTGLNSTRDIEEIDFNTEDMHSDTDALASSVRHYFYLMKHTELQVEKWKIKFQEALTEIQNRVSNLDDFIKTPLTIPMETVQKRMQSNLTILKTKYKSEFTNCIVQIESKITECTAIKLEIENFKAEALQIGQMAVKEDLISQQRFFEVSSGTEERNERYYTGMDTRNPVETVFYSSKSEGINQKKGRGVSKRKP